ncbi:MAG: molybdenum cofactor synthesis domain-containing protein [Planctomycetota bacterium]
MRVVSVNISEEKGTRKFPVDRIEIGHRGVRRDAHAGDWHRQVSMISEELLKRFSRQTGRETGPGEFAENITLAGVDLAAVSLLDRFSAGPLLLEVTQIGKQCHGDSCVIFREVGRCMMPKAGIFCRVLRGGELKPGDRLDHVQKSLRMAVVTVSDRASRGDYEDRGGPAVVEILEEFFRDTRWRIAIERSLVSDDAERLRDKIESLLAGGCDVVITTGGTGVGPRDCTPEVMTALCDKLVPGIMESIRLKCGENNPRALLSRGVAGTAGRSLVYSLPGSVKAIGEYVPEILRTTEHLLLMVNGIGH